MKRVGALSQAEIFALIQKEMDSYDWNDNKPVEIGIPDLSGIKYMQGTATGNAVIKPGRLAPARCQIVVYSATGSKKEIKLSDIKPLKNSDRQCEDGVLQKIYPDETGATATNASMQT